jgi:hypothetical protein
MRRSHPQLGGLRDSRTRPVTDQPCTGGDEGDAVAGLVGRRGLLWHAGSCPEALASARASMSSRMPDLPSSRVISAASALASAPCTGSVNTQAAWGPAVSTSSGISAVAS